MDTLKFTNEQEAIFAHSGDIKINAVAGSGKTTALVEYARRQPSGTRILYLAFNRSVRMEAQKRFTEQNLPNVDVQTAHSLAFRRAAIPNGYKVSSGYKIHDVAKILGLDALTGESHAGYIIARHVMKFAALFCNSDKAKVQEIDYCTMLTDAHGKAAARFYYSHIENGTRQFLAKMDRKEIDVTHDFYLKKFQLAKPVLPYNIILFDEGQDASPVMLDVFLSQKARKVVVGDVHQQIYGWRHAINALRQVDFPVCSLTTSFRFNEHVAALAMDCLAWKKMLGEYTPISIIGAGINKKVASRATIARTNLALLKKAIDTMQHDRSVKSIYFEGNINSYTYAADGASIYDVLNLYLDKRTLIRDPLIAQMRDYDELEEYAEKSEDMELNMLIDIVDEYGKDIPMLLKKLSAMHVSDENRHKADMIFSTLHRCKGMEYDSVTLTEDFITQDRISKLLAREKEDPVDRDRLNEEINLAYVAVTRSRNFLDFPEDMFPLADKKLFSQQKKRTGLLKSFPKKNAGTEQQGRGFGNAYKPWSKEDDVALEKMFLKGKTVREMSNHFDRNNGAITSRLRKLGWDE